MVELKEHSNQREVSKELFSMYLKNMERACNIIEIVKPIIWKFDCKVYNARFENAMNAELKEHGETATVNVKRFSDDHIDIESQFYDIKDRCYSYIRVREWRNEVTKDYSCCYLPDCYDCISICYKWEHVPYSQTYEERKKYQQKNNGTWYYYDDNYNRRIDAGKIVELMTEKQKAIKADIEKLKEELNKLDEYETKLNNLKKELEELNHAIPSEFRDFFGLKSYVSQWS